MKRACLLLPLVCSIPVLLSCSTPTPHAEKAMRIEPVLSIRNSDSTARGFYQLGRYYQGQNRLDQAADAYRKALELHATFVDARSALGTIYSAQGRFDEAIAEFTAALKIVPELAHVYNNLGYTYYLRHDYADAVAAFQKAIALEPRNQRAVNNLRSANQKLGDAEGSQVASASAAELKSPSPSAAGPITATAVAIATAAAEPNETRSVSIVVPTVAYEVPTQTISVALNSASEAHAISLTETTMVASALEAIKPDRAGETQLKADTQLRADRPAASVSKPFVVDHNLPLNKLLPVAIVADGNGALGNRPVQVKAFRLEIANGNGVTGLAKKVGNTLVHHGSPLAKLTNLKPFQQRYTVIQYRTGFQDDALRLSRKLIYSPTLVNDDHLRKSADVRLVLGRDMVSHVALFGSDTYAVRVAYNDVVR